MDNKKVIIWKSSQYDSFTWNMHLENDKQLLLKRTDRVRNRVVFQSQFLPKMANSQFRPTRTFRYDLTIRSDVGEEQN